MRFRHEFRHEFPALLSFLSAWAAEHHDRFDRVYLSAYPGELVAYAVEVDGPYDPAEFQVTVRVLHDLQSAVHQAGICRGVDFLTNVSGYRKENPRDAIALDDPDAVARIIEEVRTADEWRAEVARVAGERDEAVAKFADELNRAWEATKDLSNEYGSACGERDALRSALTRLVAARDEKDARGETDRYRELKAGAWERAREVLGGLPNTEGGSQ